VRISVIVSTHDRPTCLTRAVEAILAQSCPPFELIVVNDGAGELPGEIEAMARRAGVAFHAVRQDYPSLTASRNRGIDLSGGDVVLLGDDDVIFPQDYLQRLASMYEADVSGQIAGIGGVMVPPPLGLASRFFKTVSEALARNCWGPGRCAARYVALPGALQGRLVPAGFLPGGVISLRREIAAGHRFEERFGGYALGEDLEFSYRVSRAHALFVAPELRVRHEVSEGGRPDMFNRGRHHVRNLLYIARNSTDRGVGMWLLLGYNFCGMILLYLAFALLSFRRHNFLIALGMMTEIARQLCRYVMDVLFPRAEGYGVPQPGRDGDIRVLMVMSDLVLGGAERVSLDLVRAMEGEGFHFIVAPIRDRGVLHDAFRQAGVELCGPVAHWRFDPFGLGRLRRLIDSCAADVVFLVNTLRNGMFYSFLAAAPARHVATTCWCHSSYEVARSNARQLRLYRRAGLVDSVVCVSRHQRRELIRHGVRRKGLAVIRNSVELARFSDVPPAELPIPPGRRVMVQVANVVPEKDFETLLSAVKLLAEQRNDFHLVLVGRGTDSPDMVSRVRQLGISEHVSLLGIRQDVPAILAAADLFVLSSRQESFGISVLEAMASALPVVVSDLPAIDEFLSDGQEGLKAPPGDPAALVQAVARLLDDEALRQRLGSAGRARAEQFDTARMAGRFRRLLGALCRQSRRSAGGATTSL